MSNPAMWKFIVQVSTKVNVQMRGAPSYWKKKIPGIISQLRKQLQHIQVTSTSLLTDEKRPVYLDTILGDNENTELVLPSRAHNLNFMSVCGYFHI
ncbi:hypothetical protein AVEN_199366-1 [Araneus ventricosus]|uniref:Uncharacterized protein n=1 Tax=Araneus ventricosus TaxID=182803 RepID=A0A4Y2URE6_ARAVE|nr:hypothetical protein AVEN_199366-1 [Araneus ventricosus]